MSLCDHYGLYILNHGYCIIAPLNTVNKGTLIKIYESCKEQIDERKGGLLTQVNSMKSRSRSDILCFSDIETLHEYIFL